MFTRQTRATLIGFVSTIALGGCGADGNAAESGISNDIKGSVKEWAVSLDATAAKAGDVKFTIENDGTIGHEFLVVKTDIAPGEIPLDGDHFPEPAEGLEVIDEIGEFAVETSETLSLNLEPGNYQVVCNLPGHYKNGMHLGFTVVP
ncbi:MAG: hypothetical protein EBQ54_00940 [Actinobacteria bacterium]|nr:hypothetical protein [Actinomycetota bacterium]